MTKNHRQQILNHIASQPEHEVCGLIGGIWQPYDRLAIAKQVISIPNIAPNAHIAYLMEPKAQIEAMLAFESDGLETVGVYHSHPHGPTRPSPTDIAESYYSDMVYLIGTPGGEIAAWRIMENTVRAVNLQIV